MKVCDNPLGVATHAVNTQAVFDLALMGEPTEDQFAPTTHYDTCMSCVVFFVSDEGRLETVLSITRQQLLW